MKPCANKQNGVRIHFEANAIANKAAAAAMAVDRFGNGEEKKEAEEAKEAKGPENPTPNGNGLTQVPTMIVDRRDQGEEAVRALNALRAQRLTAVRTQHPQASAGVGVVGADAAAAAALPTAPRKIRSTTKVRTVRVTDAPLAPPSAPDGADIVQGGPPLGVRAPSVRRRRTAAQMAPPGVIPLGDASNVSFGDADLQQRLPPPVTYDMRVSSYYMNNRELFVNFINDLFLPYKEELQDESKEITCESLANTTNEVQLLTHQKIVREYINLYTPYRGLLLYHGLGAGKTYSSIAIAEGLKSSKQIIIMTPASLRQNYLEEIKKYGDAMYRKNQYWEWFPYSSENEQQAIKLAEVLNISIDSIRRAGGAWLVNVTKPSNYTELSSNQKASLNKQIELMIQSKYMFINYNGLRRDKLKQMTKDYTVNIFDNAVVIIDEAHNFISRIVNKLNGLQKKEQEGQQYHRDTNIFKRHLFLSLYQYLLSAERCRIVLLSGTPMINYPNEIAILFNILRGYIQSWSFVIEPLQNKAMSKEALLGIFEREKILDYVDYTPSTKTVTITRNPLGFESKITSKGYKGVTNEMKEKTDRNGDVVRDQAGNPVMEERGMMTNGEFIKRIVKLLAKHGVEVVEKSIVTNLNTALPDSLEEFLNVFVDERTEKMKNVEKFKRRVLGLTSYFRSAQEKLLPKYDKEFDKKVVRVPMSNYQFKMYEEYRSTERLSEKSAGKNAAKPAGGDMFNTSSTYRIFSRLACNFVMPVPPGRPVPATFRSGAREKWGELATRLIQEYERQERNGRAIPVEQNRKIMSDVKGLKFEMYAKHLDFEEVLSEYIRGVLRGTVTDAIAVYLKANLKKKRRTATAAAAAPEGEGMGEAPAPTEGAKKVRASRKKTQATAVVDAAAPESAAPPVPPAVTEPGETQFMTAMATAPVPAPRIPTVRSRSTRRPTAAPGGDVVGGGEHDNDSDNSDRDSDNDSDNSNSDSSDSDSSDSDNDHEKEDEDEDALDSAERELETNEAIQIASEMVPALLGGSGEDNGVRIAAGDELVVPPEVEDNPESTAPMSAYQDPDAKARDIENWEGDEVLELMGDTNYRAQMETAMQYLKENPKLLSLENLETYSPKYLAMIENITAEEHAGLHLIYSQFRTMEGIGIFALSLEANGFAKFSIKRNSSGQWYLDIAEEDWGKPFYALYTGTEDTEEREIIRNIYNSNWEYIPNQIADALRKISSNNYLGEIIKVLMITAAGSEGINLRNTRYVHIMEPYWHPVRIDQVIGRARRICSHQSLDEPLRTVNVFMYIATFTAEQMASEYATELKLKDLSKKQPHVPQSSDEYIYEIMTIKEKLTVQFMNAVKESAIDCATHIQSINKEGLTCLSFGTPDASKFTYNPNYAQDENDSAAMMNKVKIDWPAKDFEIKSTGKKYVLRTDTYQVYDYDSVDQVRRGFLNARPILIGKLVKKETGYEIVKDDAI